LLEAFRFWMAAGNDRRDQQHEGRELVPQAHAGCLGAMIIHDVPNLVLSFIGSPAR